MTGNPVRILWELTNLFANLNNFNFIFSNFVEYLKFIT
jgi:hypothetical protein